MTLLTDFIKAIHVSSGIILLAVVVFSLIIMLQKNVILLKYQGSLQSMMKGFDKVAIITSILAVLGGTLLVPLKNYTYTTPWIEAAYLLIIVCGLLIRANIWLRTQMLLKNNKKYYKAFYIFNSLLVIVLIFLIAHDAVFKSTYL